jgi:hypothetical protein
MSDQDVGSIITEYLRKNGFDGLCSDDCGCLIDDLFPCGQPWPDCVPGVSNPERAKEMECDFWVETKP